MALLTKHFGEIEVDDTKIIIFEEGIPGFLHLKKFLLLEDEKQSQEENEDSENNVFWYLQSVEDENIAFVLLNTFNILPDYDPKINPEDISDLGEYNAEDFLVFNITVIPQNTAEMSVNLKAPIIINTALKKGKQVVVVNEEYRIRHYIMDELKNKR